MKNKEKNMLQHQQEKAQIQLLIIDWVYGVPFSPTQNNQGLWGIRISNYSQTAFRDFYLEFQDKQGNSGTFYTPYIRPGDFFLDKEEHKDEIYCRLRAVETFNMHFDTLASPKTKSFPEKFEFHATCKDIENRHWKFSTQNLEWQQTN